MKQEYKFLIVFVGALLLGWFIWHEIKKTASDTSNTVNGAFSGGLKLLNPFA